MMGPTTWKDTPDNLQLAALFLLAFAVAALFLTGGDVASPENLAFFKKQESYPTKNGGCDLFSGRWVYDNVSYPLYRERNCPYIKEDFGCERHGRKDLKYQQWRWQPHHCDLPKFNGTAILEKLRNKVLLFVGDSLNRNQWRSLICLIDPYIPWTNKRMLSEGNLLSLRVEDYNATIGFYWSPYLVESNFDNKSEPFNVDRMIRFKSIEKHAKQWSNADVLVFDTFAWWIVPKIKILWGSFDSPNAISKKFKVSPREYEVVLNTWSDWLEYHIDRNKTKIFFVSPSPYRLGRTYSGTSSACYNATEPISDERYWANAVKRSMMEVVESTIEKLGERGVKVEYLNITQLSGYREDAHPSIYKAFWKSADKDPKICSDCMHWCLPGVPDVWNQILYAYIMKP